jgi:hypothetical protein
VRPMRKFLIAVALVAMSAPVVAQGASSEVTKPTHASALRVAMNEVVILRYRTALKLKAEQEKYWPAVASALRTLAREPELNEEAVRRFLPAASALYAILDDRQKETAMSLIHKAGLTEYASLF